MEFQYEVPALKKRKLRRASARKKQRRSMEAAGKTISIYLNREVLELILVYLPLKQLIRLKLVSKSWCETITDFRQRRVPLIHSVCLALHSSSKVNKNIMFTTVLTVGDPGKECSKLSELKLDLSGRRIGYINEGVELVDSVDGWLLYGKHVARKGDCELFELSTQFLVFNPVLGRIQPLPEIPEEQPSYDHTASANRVVRCSMFKTSMNEIKIMCFGVSEFSIHSNKIRYYLYSLHENEWQLHEHKARLENPRGLLLRTYVDDPRDEPRLNGVWHKGNLYCVLDDHMWIYDNERDCFRFDEVMPARCRFGYEFLTRNGMLVESEGVLYYVACWVRSRNMPRLTYESAFVDSNPELQILVRYYGDAGIHLWSYEDDDTGNEAGTWSLKHEVVFEELPSCDSLKPVVFNEELQVLYLLKNQTSLYSYSLETKGLSQHPPLSSMNNDEMHCLSGVTFPISKSLCLPALHPSLVFADVLHSTRRSNIWVRA